MKINGDLVFKTKGAGELQNAVIERVFGGVSGSTLPTGVEGYIVYNKDSDSYWYYAAGSVNAWVEFGAGVDLTNIINSGGYLNGDGTFDASAFNGFTNVDNTGSPFANLVDALAQMDAAIQEAVGIDTLEELTDTTISSPTTGEILYYKDGTDKWTQSDVTGLSDGDVLTWDNGNSTWAPTAQTNLMSLPDNTDVDNAATSGANNGEVLRYNSGAAPGSEWNSEDLDYITTADGRTYIDLTSGTGTIQPRVDGNKIDFYIDYNSTATRVATFNSTQLEFLAVSKTGAAGANLVFTAGTGTTGAGGDISMTAGDGDTTEGGDINITAGGGLDTVGSGDITITGGSNTNAPGARVLVGGGGTSNDGGNLIINAGNGTGTDGQLSILSGTTGTGTGVIQIQTAGRIQAKAPYVELVNTTASAAGVLRYQEGTSNGVNYIGLKAPNALSNDVTWQLPVGGTPGGSPLEATYYLGVDSVANGQTHQLKWVAGGLIGGNSFSTWAKGTGGSGDASIVAESTTDTVTLNSGDGINIDFDEATDTLTFSHDTSGASNTAVAGADVMLFFDGGVGGSLEWRSWTNILADLNIANRAYTTSGIMTHSADDTWNSITLAGSTTHVGGVGGGTGLQGISVNVNSYTSGMTLGLDISGLSDGGVPGSTEQLVVHDGTNNVYATVADLASAVANTGNINLPDLGDVHDGLSPAQGHILYYEAGGGSPTNQWLSALPGPMSGVQVYDAGLTSIAGLSLTANDFIYVTDGSPETFATIASGTTGRDLLGDETVSDAITTLGLDSGGANDIWVDVAGDTMHGDLDMSGGSPKDARILLTAGSQAAPGITWWDDLDTGLFHHGDNGFCAVTGGVVRMTWDPSDSISKVTFKIQDGSATTPGLTFESDPNSGLFRVSPDILGFSVAGSERLRLYGSGSGSPTYIGALSVENTVGYENLIPDPASVGFSAPVDDFLPNAQWVDLYYLRKTGGTMTGDLVMSGSEINMGGSKITNLGTPTSSLDATTKTYVDNLVSSGTRWVNPVRNPDLVGIANNEPHDPLPSGMYVAYGGSSYPQYWSSTGQQLGSPGFGSPRIGNGSPLVEVNEYDMMHFNDEAGEWQNSGPLQTGTRLLVGVFTNAVDHTAGQSIPTGLYENDFVQYVGGGSPNDPNLLSAWTFPHGRVGGVTFSVVSVHSGTNTFVVSGNETASFHPGNTMKYITGGSPAATSGGSPAGGSPGSNAGTYNILSVSFTGGNTEIIVEEDILYDTLGGLLEPEMANGTTTLTANDADSHFGQTYLYIADDNEWVQIAGPGATEAGVGLSFAGNVLNVNLGAGIFEQPNDEVGIELYNVASGALILTTDGSTRSTSSSAKLHLLLDPADGLDQGVSGLKVATGGISNEKLVYDYINFIGDAGTPTNVSLGRNVTFNGTNGVVTTITPSSGSPSSEIDIEVEVDLVSVPNSALANSSIGLDDGVNSVDEVALGEDISLTGAIAAGSNVLKFYRIEDGDGDTYVQTTSGPGADTDTLSIVSGGGSTGTFNATGVTLSGSAIDINATSTVVTIDATTSATLTGGVDANLVATTGDALVQAASGSVELQATTAVEVLDNIDLRLMDADNSNYIGHKSNATVTSNVTYEWPEAPTDDGYILTSTTGGVMSWASPDSVGRTRLEDLNDVDANTSGSPLDETGNVLVASGGSPKQYASQAIQFIYDSTLATPAGSPPIGSPNTPRKTHIITHNLGQKYVNVTVYDVNDYQIIPQSVKLDSDTQLTITFNTEIDCRVVIMGVPGIVPASGE